ncbi:hypothetical protein [Nocardia sp. NPDC005366]|uniref:hypothetical protein n=1 Tax=Nocardia sp. NPDC005366 TaxID=3156878 RepID=UPI0033A5B30C
MVVSVVNLITKVYPSLADVYAQVTEVNEETGETINIWDYDNPMTIKCNVYAINPQDSLEQFGEFYNKKIFLKIEYPSDVIRLSDQVGRLRRKDNGVHYYGSSLRPMVFNVSGISAQVDQLGNATGYAAYLEYYRTLEL